jgi:hypothetical protein
MLIMNLVFLIFRFVLRHRQRDGLLLSDFFAFCAFLIIITGTLLVTYANGQEIEYMKEHPDGPVDPRTGKPNPLLDPVFGFTLSLKTLYGKVCICPSDG